MSPHMPFGSGYPSAPQADGIDVVAIYGLDPTGAEDSTERLQDAVTANPDRRLRLRSGRYTLSETIHITDRFTNIIAEPGGRASNGGTEITYTGTGPCIEIGSDNGQPWDDGDYDGPQDQWFENLWIRHGAPDTALDNGINSYKAGAYGIRDWRAGGLRLYNCGFEHFEYNFWGVQSDILDFDNITSLYSKYGLYFGPRSDQVNVNKLLTFYCDRAITLDRCSQFRLVDAQVVGCGTTTAYAIEIRKGTDDARLVRPWFENFDVTDMVGFVGAGLVDGYGPGGVGTTTDSAKGISIDEPFVYTTAVGSPGHAKCVVGLGAATGVYVHHPETKVGASLSNLDAIVIAPAGTSFTFSQSNAHISGVDSNITLAKVYLNQGSGSPNVSMAGMTGSGMTIASTSAAGLTIKRIGGNAAEDLQIGAQGLQGRIRIVSPNFSGQTTRLGLDRSIQHGTAAPVAGTWAVGDRIINQAPAVGQPKSWVCTVAGTPGTWVSEGNL